MQPETLPLVFCLLLVGGLFLGMAHMGEKRTLRRNGLIGVRLASTMQSDAAWYAAHKAIAPTLRVCGWAQIIGAAVLLALESMTESEGTTVLTGLAFLMIPTLVLVFVSATRVSTIANEAHQAWEKEREAAASPSTDNR
ncbi:MAG: SdpI family protein [Rothia sp. (in: high G+C Gram-positive bacteria)]|nr:SdpI family protein [Rothia sp. (in: high G+C Gram-positive bacteria)]